MAEEGQQPIIIKRVKKGGHGHHGGAWKVAYADFVTAMMAFFLLLWLLNAVTEEQLQGISNYFAPTTVSRSTSGAGGVLGGKVIGEGASSSNSASPSIAMTLPPPSIGEGTEGNGSSPDETEGGAKEGSGGIDSGTGKTPSEKDIADAAARKEQEEFEKMVERLDEAIDKTPDLQKMKRNLIVDNTAEGLRIQLLDQEGSAMFPSGSSAMFDHTRKLLTVVAEAIAQMPEKISISGHTDSVPFPDPTGYSNWELSADRALAARRILLAAGVPAAHITRVSGRAETDPLIKEDPTDPRNRRLGIVLLRDAPPVPQSGAGPDSSPKPSGPARTAPMPLPSSLRTGTKPAGQGGKGH
ncbi:MAG: flagellar motor protein MotB [Alphaproteobacteria bacterium]